MSKVWTIIRHEYVRHVLRKRFLIALLSVPLWIVVMGAVAVLSVFLTNTNIPVGYVDESGLLAHPVFPDAKDIGPFGSVEIVAFASQVQARAALDDKKIQGYYILPKDYLQTRSASLFYGDKELNSGTQRDFEDFLRRNLLTSQPKDVADRIIKGPNLVIQATQEKRTMGNNDWFKVVMPIAGGILLIVGVFTSGGYLMQAVVEEKENRTMEILATSVSPMQIMGGKIIALLGVGLTQMLVWSLFPLLGVIIATALFPTFRAVVDWGTVGIMFLLILPTFVMISALMAAIGATVTDAREGQQVSGLISLPVWIPYMLMGVFITNPGSPIAIFFSFFPLTAALTILIRTGFGSVPLWQTLLSAAILIASAVGSLWLAGRIFRLGMLRYGQRLRWNDIFRSFRKTSQ